MKELSLKNSRLDGRYDILNDLGRGSYAEIFLATDTLASTLSPHATVVIKALNVFLQDDLDADLERTLVENFQNEAAALDRVRHPNIISRIGHGTSRDLQGTVFHYLVLEYLSGGNLQSALRNGGVSSKKALTYIEQICAGLAHAHGRGIIHRDIKPQNLLLTGDQVTIKIADFGVARITMNDAPITRVGTNIYAPPEHSPLSAGKTGKLGTTLSPAADVYSLAKTVYTLLTGEAPRGFSNNPINSLPDECRGEQWADDLLRVLAHATADDPLQRHQTVEAFWNDMAAVRQIVEDDDSETVVRNRIEPPQAHVARGYTPLVPEQPHFKPLSNPAFTAAPRSERMKPAMPDVLKRDVNPRLDKAAPIDRAGTRAASTAGKPGIKKTGLRRLVTFGIFLLLFTGILYGTHAYMSGTGIISGFRNPFATQTAVANTDIYLRPAPNTDNDPIGLVTRKSKVRIVKAQNNWYQVDVIEQGRTANFPAAATRGWLYGKYVDIENN